MYKITDIQTLGTDYTVADSKGHVIKTIQVVTLNEILDAALGPFSEDIFDNFGNYLEKSIAVLSGFDNASYLKTLVYSSFDEDVVIYDIIEYAVKQGYDRVILEHLEDIDE